MNNSEISVPRSEESKVVIKELNDSSTDTKDSLMNNNNSVKRARSVSPSKQALLMRYDPHCSKRSRTWSSSYPSFVIKSNIIDIEGDSDHEEEFKVVKRNQVNQTVKSKEENAYDFEREFSKVFDKTMEKSLFKKIEDLTKNNTKVLKELSDKEVVIRDLEKNAKEVVDKGLKLQNADLTKQVSNLNLALSRKNQIIGNLQRENEELRWNFQNFRQTIYNFLASMYPNVLHHFNVFTNNF